MRRSAAYVVVLLIVVVVAAALSVYIFFGPDRVKETEPPQIHTAVPETNAVVTETTEEPVSTPVPETEPPVFETREPIETEPPEETEAPVETEAPLPEPVDASGSFASNTGTYLNMVADWSAKSDADGNVKLTVNLNATSYSFFTSALYNSLELTVNGETYTANSPAISYDGKDLKTSPLASFTVDVPKGNVSISAVWHYKGTYSGKELTDITASGTAYIG